MPWYARPIPIGIVTFLALVVIKFDTLSEPPAWDAAMSVHPAAITLAETGFDYPALLSREGFSEGGPNTHSLSLYTATAAGAYWLFEPQTALATLHLLTFLFGSLTAVALVRFAGHFMSPPNAAITALVGLATPVVLTQFGMVYLEAPVLAASTWAMVYAVERRWVPTAGLVLLAIAIKPSGAVTAAALGFFFIMQKGRWKQAVAILLPSAVLLLLVSAGSPAFVKPSVTRAAILLNESWRNLLFVPDLLVVLVAAVLAGLRLSKLRPRESGNDLGELWPMSALAFILFYGALTSVGFRTLPRYYALIAPLAVVTFLAAAANLHGRTAFNAIAVVLLAFSVVNFDGSLYPGRELNFSLIERSDAYDDLLALQEAISESICELSPTAPVWYGRPEMYRLNYPRMGYVSCSDPGRAFPTEAPVQLAYLPDRLIIAYENSSVGGATLRRLVREAEAAPNWTVTVERTLESGPFTQDIYRLTRTDSP